MMEISKASAKKIDELLDLLKDIQGQKEIVTDLLIKFRDRYQEILPEERPWFFEAVIRQFEVGKKDIERELRLLLADEGKDPVLWGQSLSTLRRKIGSPRIQIFRNFLNISGGLNFLLDLRADVLSAQRQNSFNLEPLDQDIAQLFNLWFQGGFLFLNEIILDSPYRQIRYLKEHDLVHPMASLEEMGSRLGRDRRCFGLYHRLMPDEPITFIEVALTRGIATSIHEIIEKQEAPGMRKKTPDTAIFYSINNTQNGLAGLGLGKVLIFQVVETLEKSHPGIKTFSTLSPIPGFWERYLKPILKGEKVSFQMNQDRLAEFFPEKIRQTLLESHQAKSGKKADLCPALLEILSDVGWIDDPDYLQNLRKPLTETAYFYLSQEKDRRGKPLNPVANFHLGNGATISLKNVNFAANRFPRGLTESCGLMVNYIYSQTWLQQIGRTMKAFLPWRI
ncbi:MAG: malonyl-CoA decarboxylase family protein [Deltaproteobacteria bacterium]|nr:malonyl-CoA decarboxylase family protein [Deltaproteobacteria bacterium]